MVLHMVLLQWDLLDQLVEHSSSVSVPVPCPAAAAAASWFVGAAAVA